jgi:uncharacterized protein (DUF433 family)
MELVISAEPVPLRLDEQGVMRVGGTRVTLHTVISAYRGGETPEVIARQYPSVSLADIYAVITYYLRHREEVDAYLSRQEEEADRTRREMEARFDPAGVRERLLARRSGRSEP